MTVAKKAAKRTTKKAVKKAVRRDDPFPNISVEDKQKLAELIMNFDEPEICRDGRKRFLKSIQFPLPQRHVKLWIPVLVPLNEDDVEENAWGSENIVDEDVIKSRALEYIDTDLDIVGDESYTDEIVD